jgi:hypothetical protein
MTDPNDDDEHPEDYEGENGSDEEDEG